MKKYIKSFVVAAILFAAPASSFAQKIAHLDFDSLLQLMPEMADAKKKSEEYYKQLESQLVTMNNDLQSKIDDYTQNKEKYTDLIKQVKEKEITDLQQRLQDFQMQAQKEFQAKNAELSKPIEDKAKKAVEAVAKAKGYKYVIDTTSQMLLVSDPSRSEERRVGKECRL